GGQVLVVPGELDVRHGSSFVDQSDRSDQADRLKKSNGSISRADLCQSSGSVSTPARSRRILLAILAVALAFRLAHWWAVRDEPFFAQLAMDSQEYDRWAGEIAGGDWLGAR